MKRRIVEILREINGGGVVYDEITHKYTLFYKVRKGKRVVRMYTYKKDVTDNFTEIEDKPQIVPYPSLQETEKCISVCKRKTNDNYDITNSEREWVFISVLQSILLNEVIPKDHVEIYSIIGNGVIDTYGHCDCLR